MFWPLALTPQEAATPLNRLPLLRAEDRTEDLADANTGASGRRVSIASAHMKQRVDTRLALNKARRHQQLRFKFDAALFWAPPKPCAAASRPYSAVRARRHVG